MTKRRLVSYRIMVEYIKYTFCKLRQLCILHVIVNSSPVAPASRLPLLLNPTRNRQGMPSFACSLNISLRRRGRDSGSLHLIRPQIPAVIEVASWRCSYPTHLCRTTCSRLKMAIIGLSRQSRGIEDGFGEVYFMPGSIYFP
jgi:hypothetical protein